MHVWLASSTCKQFNVNFQARHFTTRIKQFLYIYMRLFVTHQEEDCSKKITNNDYMV